MAGLFGFFLREPRDEAWATRRFAAMAAGARSASGHHLVATATPQARVGLTGPGLLPGSLAVHGEGDGPRLLAEGECYHRDHALAPGESSGGPWRFVLDQWRRHGASGLRALDGLYTLALVETDPPRLRLINDRYGSRRLYVLDTGAAWVFAASLGPLLAWPEAGEVDPDYIRQMVCLGSALDGRTWLRGVTLMPAATEYTVTPARTTATSYWRWDDLGGAEAAREPRDTLTRDEVTALAERWDTALHARVHGERVGQLLSGGLDSRLILAGGAPRRGRDWVTVTYGEPGADEVRFASQAAAVAGVPWLHWILPEPHWLETRTRFCLAHDGVIDIVNAYPAGLAGRLAGLMQWEVNGYLGDVVLGGTYHLQSPEAAMAHLPYWHSPVALPEAEVRAAVTVAIGAQSPRAWLIDTKCRRAINAWPHAAVDGLEVRKPFLDYALVELAERLPLGPRARHEPHLRLLARTPALAAVPWQKTGVAPGAPTAAVWAMRARRVAYRAWRAGLARLGVARPGWVRGAVDFGAWLALAGPREVLRETLGSPDARVGTYFAAAAIDETIRATLIERRLAHEPLLHLYLAERMLIHLDERRRAPLVAPSDTPAGPTPAVR